MIIKEQNIFLNGSKKRVRLVFILGIAFWLILIARLFYIQVWKADFYQQKATRQTVLTIQLPAERGIIYDRDGAQLALNLPCESFFAVPDSIKNPEITAAKLSSLLDKSASELKQDFLKPTQFSWIGRQIEKNRASTIKKLNLKGIYSRTEVKRVYPQDRLAQDLIGFTDIDNKGIAGIELAYDSILAGKDGKAVLQKDALGREYELKPHPIYKPANGKSLVLTLDSQLQWVLEEELKGAVDSTQAQSGMGIFINPHTGEILACDYYQPGEDLPFKNRLMADQLEPGSTFKIVVAAAALEQKLRKPEDLIYAEMGKYRIGKHTLHDVKKKGWITFREAVVHSSNIAISKVAKEVGRNLLYDYAKRFGFGELTGIDLPGESKGYISQFSRWSEIGLANIAIGQGVAVTPLQLIRAYGALANGGVLMKPYLIKEILDEENNAIRQFQPTPVRRAISQETASTLTDFLQEAVESGSGQNAKLTDFSIAGKTGTAQKPKVGSRGYETGKYIASFVGFFPSANPQMVGLILIDSPQGEHLGGHVAAPVFKKIVTKLVSLPENPVRKLQTQKESFTQTVPDIQPEESRMALVKLVYAEEEKVESKIIETSPYAKEGGIVDQNTDKTLVPNLIGLTAREAMGILNKKKIKFQFSGSGLVKKQIPQAGSVMKEQTKVYFECQTPE